MEMTKQGITDMISHSESMVEEILSSITANQLEVLEYCANYIDTGHINCDSTHWAMLMYYPSPVMPVKKMKRFTYWYVYQDLYMSALNKLGDYLEDEKHIYEYMDFSMQFFLESDPAIDNSDKGSNNEEYCRALKPEQVVSYKTSDQQEETHQAKQHPQPTTIKHIKRYPSNLQDMLK